MVSRANLTRETTNTSGTGPYELNGANDQFQTFVSGVGDGAVCYYSVFDGNDFEVGRGTVSSGSPDTLSRDAILESTNANAKVDWPSSGERTVSLVLPATQAPIRDENEDLDLDIDSGASNNNSRLLVKVDGTERLKVDSNGADVSGGLGVGSPTGGVPAAGKVNATNLQVNGNDLIPSGTVMIFYQASAPSGWTQDTSINDRVLRVTSGSGGSTGGDGWTITGLSSAGQTTGLSVDSASSGVTVDGHTLTEAEMPSHNHGGGGNTGSAGANEPVEILGQQGASENNAGAGFVYDVDQLSDISYKQTESDLGANSSDNDVARLRNNHNHSYNIPTDGSDNAHSHSTSNDSHSHTTTESNHSHTISQDGSWRPDTIEVIAASKD